MLIFIKSCFIEVLVSYKTYCLGSIFNLTMLVFGGSEYASYY